ncbi:MAG TPA: ABC transporter permease, partial [Myxococcus sp.]|nr:ABC transporter permease [Myxococcus sp.]
MASSRANRTLGRILAMAGKEVLHIRRDIRTLYLALAMPVLLLVLFGFGISFDVDHLELAVVDQDRTEASRELVRQVTASGEFVLEQEGTSPEEALGALRRGHAVAVLVVPRGFAQNVARGGARVQLLVDGADGNTATQVLAKAQALVAAAGPRLLGAGARVPAPPLEVRLRTLFNPNARSALFLVPGLAAYLLAIVAVLITALTVAREWERGSMEQLFATPVGRLEIVVGKLLPYLGIGLLQVLLVLTVGAWVFDVPVRGSLVALGLGALLFLVGMLGQGLLISVVTRNQV